MQFKRCYLSYLDARLAGGFVPLAGALRRLLDAAAGTDLLLRADERDGAAAADEAGEVALDDDFDDAGVADRPVVVEVSPLLSVRYFGFWTLGVDGVLLAPRLFLGMALQCSFQTVLLPKRIRGSPFIKN